MFLKKSFLLIFLYAFFSHGVLAETCSAGQYGNNGTCEQCSGNTYSGDDASECISCGENTYANSDHTACVACDGLNEYHNNGVCQTCNAGYYVNDNVCTICPAGSYCGGDGTAAQCSKGTYSAAGASECTECPVGYTTDSIGKTSISDCKTMDVNLGVVNFSEALYSFFTVGRINTDVITKKTAETSNQNNEND